ncbi:MAG: universal stress protein [Cryobacterium sp.]
MSTVVVGVDHSESCRRAALFAARLARESGADLHVVHVIPWSPYTFNTPEENERRSLTKIQEIDAAQRLIIDPVLALLKEATASVRVESSVLYGGPAEHLAAIAGAQPDGHVVVGRVGESRLRQVLFGSTPSKLIQIATTPVTVIP